MCDKMYINVYIIRMYKLFADLLLYKYYFNYFDQLKIIIELCVHIKL